MKRQRGAGIIMIALSAVFFIYAMLNPQGSFPWPNSVTYLLYAIYLAVTAILLFRR